MPPISHWYVHTKHPLTTQRTSFLGSEGEQAVDLSTGSTPTGNVEGSFVWQEHVCVSELSLRANDVAVLHAHLSPHYFIMSKYIFIFLVIHRTLYRAIAPFVPLVVLIRCH